MSTYGRTRELLLMISFIVTPLCPTHILYASSLLNAIPTIIEVGVTCSAELKPIHKARACQIGHLESYCVKWEKE